MYAVRRGYEGKVNGLLDMRASVNLVGGRGRTASFEAVLCRNDQMIGLLLFPDSRRSVLDSNNDNSKNRDRTPLMLTAHIGEKTILSSLLKHPDI